MDLFPRAKVLYHCYMPKSSLRILVTAMDWGLGHATRCVPLIESLLRQGARVHLGSSGSAAQFWRKRFAQLPLHELPGYAVRYSAGPQQWPILLRQLPRLRRVIADEHRRTETLMQQHQLDAVISDHRYGCWSQDRPSVWLAHQLALRLPPGFAWAESALAHFHYQFLRPFSQHWVPDTPPPHGLAGRLVSEYPYAQDLTFLGPLSRLKRSPASALPTSLTSTSPPYVALLSGPEPQRSQLEARLKVAAPALDAELWVIQGLPGPLQVSPGPNGRLLSFLDAEALAALLLQAKAVIARSGYSSLMDFAALRLPRLLLIPTPGQTEQQYLAQRWAEAGWALRVDQAQLALPHDLQRLAAKAPARWPKTENAHPDQALDRVLGAWLNELRQGRR